MLSDIVNAQIRKIGSTQEAVAGSCGMSRSAFLKRVNGEQVMTPDDALAIAEAIDLPQLTQSYCASQCAIGKAYCYPTLNNVNLAPVAGWSKLRQELKELQMLVDSMIDLTMNKESADDYDAREKALLEDVLEQGMDVEHTFETVKMQSYAVVDVKKVIKRHNQKCLDKKYVDLSKPEIKIN